MLHAPPVLQQALPRGGLKGSQPQTAGGADVEAIAARVWGGWWLGAHEEGAQRAPAPGRLPRSEDAPVDSAGLPASSSGTRHGFPPFI